MNIDHKQYIKLLVPYFAVGVFWCIFKNAWLSIIAYHLLILFFCRKSDFKQLKAIKPKYVLFALPTVIAGPMLYFLLPYVTQIELSVWLQSNHLSSSAVMLLIPYFGIIHPILEQLHWNALRKSTKLSHFMFAGYHMIVLYTLLKLPWLIFCFAILVAASFIWKQMNKKTNSLSVPIISHILADFGVIIVTWWVTKI